MREVTMSTKGKISFSDLNQAWVQRDSDVVLGWRYYPRVVFESGNGVMIQDVDGNQYYDLTSGMMCMALGHSHPELTETIRQHAERLIHHSTFYSNPPIIEFAERICSTLPGDLKKINFAVTGSEANEVAMRAARSYTGKFDFVSVLKGLYGGTLAVESLTSVGGARKYGLGPLLMPSRTNAIVPPYCYRCWLNLEYPDCNIGCIDLSDEIINYSSTGEIAAIFTEPMMVAGGMIEPPPEWMPRLKRLAEKWGALLVIDEAQFAPAKTGKMWAFEHYDVLPDMVTFAKAMGAGLPVTGMVTTSDISEKAWGKSGFPWGGTFHQDPLAAAVGLKQLEIIIRDDYASRAATLGKYLRSQLEGLMDKYEIIGDIRGKGLYLLVEIVKDRVKKEPDIDMTNRIRFNATFEGLIFIAINNHFRVTPPLIITQDQIDDVIERLERAIKSALDGHPKGVTTFSHHSLKDVG